MQRVCRWLVLIVLLGMAQIACAVLAPARAAPQLELSPSPAPRGQPTAAPTTASASPTAAAGPVSATPSAAVAFTPTATAIPTASPSATAAALRLEVVQSQVWTDGDGNVRVNVLFRNPYDFPVAPRFRSNAELLDSAGKIVRLADLLFLDGISGTGFLLPKETLAAYACFTCEAAPLTTSWASVTFESALADATGQWQYSTAVEARVEPVSLSAGSPIFDLAGTATNKSKVVLQRIAVRVVVFDQAHKLVGAGTALASDVAAGATVHFTGYGIGQAPTGRVTVEVSVLGVNY